MKRAITILFLLVIMITIAGCYKDNEEELYPGNGGTCDVTGVTYSSTVAPLLQNNGCTGCHSGGAPSGGITLNSYTAVKGIAANGKLYGAISHAAGFSPMPKNGAKMNACDINKIKAWIDAGALNN